MLDDKIIDYEDFTYKKLVGCIRRTLPFVIHD